MKLFKKDSERLPRLFLGFFFLALGIQLTRLSGLGMNSWSVLHEGLFFRTGISFGIITQVLGLVIMVLSILLIKSKVGLGTILNVIFVGFFVDLLALILPESSTLLNDILYLLFGFIIMTFGRSLYISSSLGPGPRDGLFVGVARLTRIDVKYVKPGIELVILFIGYLLGGTVGVGTIIITLFSGYFVQSYFRLLKFDPKSEHQSDIFKYLKRESH